MAIGLAEESIMGKVFSRAVPFKITGQLTPAKVPNSSPMKIVEIPPISSTLARFSIMPLGFTYFKNAQAPSASTAP